MKFNFKAFIFAFIFCAALIISKNLFSCVLSAQIDKGIYKASKLENIDALYIGSSMFRQGINMKEIKNENSFMLSYNGFDPAMEFLVLEFLIKNGLKIKNLYIDMYAYSASGESWLSDDRMFFESPLSLKLKIFKLITQNSKANIFSAAWELFISSGNDLFILWPLQKKLTSKRYYKGGADVPGMPSSNFEILNSIPIPDSGNSSMNENQKKAIIKIINLCKNNNINLIFIETPKYIKVMKSSFYKNVMNEYIKILNDNDIKFFVSEEILKDGGRQQGSCYKFPHDNPSMFGDHIHLSTEGSREFSRMLKRLNSYDKILTFKGE